MTGRDGRSDVIASSETRNAWPHVVAVVTIPTYHDYRNSTALRMFPIFLLLFSLVVARSSRDDENDETREALG